MRIRRLLSIFMIIAIVTITACSTPEQGNGSESASRDIPPEERDLYSIKVMTLTANPVVKTSDMTPIGEVIKEKFNIVFEYIPFSGNYRDKLNMMLAAGDYPELLRVERQDLVMRYVNANAAYPLDEFLEDSEYFTEAFSEQIPYWRLASSEGGLYKWESNVPQDVNNFCECNDMAVRLDALEQQGFPELLSADDYIDFLKKAIADNPTTNGRPTIGIVAPFAESWGMAGLVPILYEKGEDYISIGNEGVIFNIKDQQFEDMWKNDYTKESFQFFNRLYREGLLSEESFTDTINQVTEKVQSGQALSIFYTAWLKDNANKQLEMAGKPELSYIQMPIQSNSQVQQGQKKNLRLESVRPYQSYMITKNAKDPYRIFELVDWAASDEGQTLLQSGVEGIHYTTENGERVMTDAMRQGYLNDPDYMAKQGFSMFDFLGVRPTSSKDGQPFNMLSDYKVSDEFNLTQTVRDAYETMGWEHSKDWYLKNGVPAPAGLASGIILDPASAEGITSQKMVELRVRNSARLIQASSDEQFETIWNELMNQYEGLNPQSVVDKYNELFNEQMSQAEQYE